MFQLKKSKQRASKPVTIAELQQGPKNMREVYRCLNNLVECCGRCENRKAGVTIARGQDRAVDILTNRFGLIWNEQNTVRIADIKKGGFNMLGVRVYKDGSFLIGPDCECSATEFFNDHCLPDDWHLVRRQGCWVMVMDADGHDELLPIRTLQPTKVQARAAHAA